MKYVLSLFILILIQNAVFAEKLHIVSFSATWCGPCQKMKSVWNSDIVKSYLENKNFYSIDVDNDAEYAKLCGIKPIPQTIILKEKDDGDTYIISRIIGYKDSNQLIYEIEKSYENARKNSKKDS